jgi:hypothetical protein
MLKPFSNYLAGNREIIESKIATLPFDSPEFKNYMTLYERLQMTSITEHLEEDLHAATGPARARLYAQFIRYAALRERTTARTAREAAASQRQLDRKKRDQDRAARDLKRTQLMESRAAERKRKQQERQARQASSSAVHRRSNKVSPTHPLTDTENGQPTQLQTSIL